MLLQEYNFSLSLCSVAVFELDTSEYTVREDIVPVQVTVFAQLQNSVTLAKPIDVLVTTLPGIPPNAATG